MSSLHPGDRHLHHADGSHRWSGGPADPRGREAFQAALRDHLEQHRTRFAPPSHRRAGPHRAAADRHPAARHSAARAANQGPTAAGRAAPGAAPAAPVGSPPAAPAGDGPASARPPGNRDGDG